MTHSEIKKLAKVLSACALGSAVITIGLAMAYAKAIREHPFPDDLAMEAAVVLGVFGLITAALIAAAFAAWVARYQQSQN